MEKIPDKILKRLNFLAESQGLIDRYIIVDGAWDNHLKNVRNFILKAVSGKKIDNLAVLGSGWLLDLPIEELGGMVDRLWLYDAFHPSQIIHRIKKYRNITAVSADITGGSLVKAFNAVEVYKKSKKKIAPELICNQIFQPNPVPDYILSLNLLSQIGIMVTEYLQRHIPYDQQEIERMNRLLEELHLKIMIPGKSCLVTDVVETLIDLVDGSIKKKKVISCSLPACKYSETWEWQFDPLGDYRQGKKTILQVIAMEF
jgi:hypothetical protein